MLFLKYFLAFLALAGFVSWAATGHPLFLACTMGAILLLMSLATVTKS